MPFKRKFKRSAWNKKPRAKKRVMRHRKRVYDKYAMTIGPKQVYMKVFKQIFPSVMYVRFKSTVNIKSPIGTNTQSGFLTVYANALYRPFNTSNQVTGTQFSEDGSPGTVGAYITDTGENTEGYAFTFLCNPQAYYDYRVLATKMTVTCLPQIVADSVYVCLAGCSSTNNTFTNTAAMMNSPYAKTRLFTPNNGPMHISKYMRTSKIGGATDTEVLSSDDYAATYNTQPAQLNVWQIGYLQYGTEATLTQGFGWSMTLEQDAQLEGFDYGNYTDNA